MWGAHEAGRGRLQIGPFPTLARCWNPTTLPPVYRLAAVQTGWNGVDTAVVWLFNVHTVQQHDRHLSHGGG